nr:hypothetical protein [Neisseria dentiae]
MQNSRLRRISSLCAARPLSLVYDMSAPAALLRLELHPHPTVLPRSQFAGKGRSIYRKTPCLDTAPRFQTASAKPPAER